MGGEEDGGNAKPAKVACCGERVVAAVKMRVDDRQVDAFLRPVSQGVTERRKPTATGWSSDTEK